MYVRMADRMADTSPTCGDARTVETAAADKRRSVDEPARRAREDGSIESERRNVDGGLHRVRRTWYPNGQLKSETLHDPGKGVHEKRCSEDGTEVGWATPNWSQGLVSGDAGGVVRQVEDAEALQAELRRLVQADAPGPASVTTVAGFDVAYDTGSDLVVGTVVVLAAPAWEMIASATAVGRAAFPYVPGLLSFRELPPLLDAWNAVLPRLTSPPDLLVCDGHGIAHPRRFGLACHLGVTLDLPTVGVAKTQFVGEHSAPGPRRGERTAIILDGEPVGAALRTRDGVREVYVSVGHRTNLDAACQWVLALCPRYRLPETTRAADHLSRQALAEARGRRPRGEP
jgi:deoxyribonuclease V